MKRLLFPAACLLLTSCLAPADRQKKEEPQKQEAAVTPTFPYPKIPAVLEQTDERNKYVLTHYWNRFDFSDSLLINDKEVSEQGVANYLALLAQENIPDNWKTESIDHFCTKMEQHGYARSKFMNWMEKYLYHPDSPFYNEPLYSIYLQRMLDSRVLDEAGKSSLDFQLKLLERNLPGAKAENFVYYLPDGSRATLDKTYVKGEFPLLIFYDPDCPNCHKTLKEMAADRKLSGKVAAGELTVLVVYTEGDEDIWRNSLADMPGEWLIGNDRQTVTENALYDLRAMPSLYLLDKHKTVILKDAPYGAVKKNLGIR